MFREGELSVRLDLHDGRIRSVEIASTRASLPPQLTRGRHADDVARTMPLLFSICARAQGAAAAGALDAARGRDDGARQPRNEAVRREAAVELLTRLLMDWPRVLGATPDVAAVARARRASEEHGLGVCREVAHQRVYQSDPARWLGNSSLESLQRWAATADTLPAGLLSVLQTEAPDLGRSDVAVMPDAGLEDVLRVLPAPEARPEFGRVPDWDGRPVETGPLARRARDPLLSDFVERHGNTVAARFVAQLVDLAMLLSTQDETWVGQYQAPGGIGIGLAETARGLLVHQAQLTPDGRVEHYRVVAPTEWNFHPQGALTRALVGRPVHDGAAARRDATLLAQALDPCVAFSVEVANA